MIRIFFNPAEPGFFHAHRVMRGWAADDPDYETELHRRLPPGVVEITEAEHAAMMEGQRRGKRISAGPEGKPVLTEHPQPTHEELVAGIMQVRSRLLADSGHWIAPDSPLSDEEKAAWLSYRKTLWAITPESLTEPAIFVFPAPPS